jgi:hypothetical protein|tara:strand:- start:302 stop:439 length:138 start_codon:yes stop_codon:yes gene_type:complete
MYFYLEDQVIQGEDGHIVLDVLGHRSILPPFWILFGELTWHELFW